MENLKAIISGMINIQDKSINQIINLSGNINNNYYNKEDINRINEYILSTIYQVDQQKIELAECTNLNMFKDQTDLFINWTDPEDIQLNGAILARWNKTILVRKENSYPSSYLDGDILATTSRELENKNYYRDHSFIDNNREEGKEYYYMLFSESKAGSWNNLYANKFYLGDSLTWYQISQFIKTGRGSELFPVGTTFIVNHDEYTTSNGLSGIAFTVLGHDQVPCSDETIQHTMCLGMSEVLFTCYFDAPELEYGLTEDTVTISGKIYYTYDGNSFIQLIEGVDYQIGDLIPSISYYEKNNTERLSGYYNLDQSNLLQWANSNGSANQWFIKQNIWDNCSTTLSSKNGFLKYLDPEFLAVVKNAKLITAVPIIDGGGSKITNTKFWPLSLTQVFGLPNNNIYENEKLQYYINDNVNLIKHDINGNPKAWWLRSVSSLSKLNGISSTGSRHYPNAGIHQFGVSLACIIG